MPNEAIYNRTSELPEGLHDLTPAFQGFHPPTSNTTYTPNQFFDVCLPHYSRGVVRLVSYMLRKVLGWSDKHGNPQSEKVLISYRDIERNAGVSSPHLASMLVIRSS